MNNASQCAAKTSATKPFTAITNLVMNISCHVSTGVVVIAQFQSRSKLRLLLVLSSAVVWYMLQPRLFRLYPICWIWWIRLFLSVSPLRLMLPLNICRSVSSTAGNIVDSSSVIKLRVHNLVHLLLFCSLSYCVFSVLPLIVSTHRARLGNLPYSNHIFLSSAYVGCPPQRCVCCLSPLHHSYECTFSDSLARRCLRQSPPLLVDIITNIL